MQTLASKYKDKGVVWLAINSTSSADQKANNAWVKQYDLSYPILDDSSGKVGKEYGAKTTPHMFVIDRSGKLVYKGGIDNDPQGEKADRINYVDQTLQQLVQGKTVELKETKSYGCSVKYSKATAEAR
jgi:peroxiredoxin